MVSKVSIKFPNKCKTEYYPCLCETAEPVLYLGRLFGITPISRCNKYMHKQLCQFNVSKSWKIYSYFIQGIFLLVAIILHGIRLGCGPNITSTMFWYVMTIGYIISDFNAVCCIVGGAFFAEKLCVILERMSRLDGSIKEMKYLKRSLRKVIFISFLCYIISLMSYTYVAILRIMSEHSFFENYCNIPDFPFAVVKRGFSSIFPAIEHVLITMLCLIIKNKFKHLMEKTDLTLLVCSNVAISTNVIPKSLKQLANDHKQITLCLKEVNTCVGLQLLVTTSSGLFTTVYFLYRYSISSREMILSNRNERIHYIIGVLYRMGNLLHLVYLGRQVAYWSQAPLRVLQNTELLNLPFKIQQQVQTLMLQWSGKIGYLSALEVINMGPWLLAPIVGNVITYLLVALQFENSSHLSSNASIILETFV